MFIKYFDCLFILNFWWKYLGVLSLNTWNLLNYFYSQGYLQQLNPEVSIIRHCQIFQHIERHHCRQAVQFIKGLRKDRSSQKRSISCSHVQQAELYLQDWCDWNKEKSTVFLVSTDITAEWTCICTCFTQQFDPLQLRSTKFTIISMQSPLLHFCSVSGGNRAEDIPLSLKILWTG